MNKTQAGRLLTLAYFLKTNVDPVNFDMMVYARNITDTNLNSLSCRTTACALGWCAYVFHDRFSLNPMHRGINFDGRLSGLTYWGVQQFFGITYEESDLLFYQHERTPKQEARVIEKLVKSKGWVYDDE